MRYKRNRYVIKECVTFRRTHEKFGGLSNMAGGYPIFIGEKRILTSEALYQACRYPDYPDIQNEIVNQKSPMTAKDVSRQYHRYTRKDWDEKRVSIMNWCIHMKLLYNWSKLGYVFDCTSDKEIIELSSKDDFWGAYERGDYAEGYNVLGILLKQLRRDYYLNKEKRYITLGRVNVENFKLFNEEIGEKKIDITQNYHVGENLSLFEDYGLR